MNKYFAEAVGTFAFVLVGCGCTAILTGNASITLICAFIYGLVFAILYYVIAKFSGCHLNPAISLAMLIKKKLDKSDCVKYILAQFGGAIAAALVLALFAIIIGGNSVNNLVNSLNGFSDLSSIGLTMGGAFIVEIIATSFFVCVFVAVTSVKSFEKFSGVIIGCTIFLLYMFLIPLTGGSINPAKSFATGFIFSLFVGKPIAMLYCLLFIFTGFFGSFFGVFISNFVEKLSLNKTTDDTKEKKGRTQTKRPTVKTKKTTKKDSSSKVTFEIKENNAFKVD